MFDIANSLTLFAGKTRWLKKRLRGLPPLVYVPLSEGRKLYADTLDMRGPSFHIMYGGNAGFENYEISEKKEILRYLPENGVFIDVGANIGLFSFYVHWNKPRATIHAFEPHPRNLDCFTRSLSANRISQVHLHAEAIGDSRGELELFFDESDSGGHSAYLETLENNLTQAQSVRVPVVTLDEFVKKNSLTRVDVIKIDTQGGEAAAIRGAQETLKRFKPTLLIECDYRTLLHGSDSGYFIQALQESGVPYQARAINQTDAFLTLPQLEAHAQKEVARGILQRNFLFIVR